jgi:hypothetical protein
VYGYPGPVATGVDDDAGFVEAAWRAIRSVWQSHSAVSAFTRFHPLLGNERLLSGSQDITYVGDTVSMDLRLTDEEVAWSYPRTLRQEIAAGRRAGLRTEVDESWQCLPEFMRLYQATMRRNRAAPSYFFSDAYFHRLRSLGDDAHLLVTRLDDEVVAAGVFFAYGTTVHAHLVGTDERGISLSPLKVLLDDARSWARERGGVVLHLGGGRGGRTDSLLEFKARFSPRRHRFSIGRWVLDGRGYRELAETWRAEAARRGVADGETEFFPAYRRGLPVSDPAG